MKGIYLNKLTIKEADNYYHRHTLRERIVRYLQIKLNRLKEVEGQGKEGTELKDSDKRKKKY